jgi:hypothetical protein
LLLNLSDNYLNRVQINTVNVQQEKMDRVGFEPTTSAMPATFYLQVDEEGEIYSVKFRLVQI